MLAINTQNTYNRPYYKKPVSFGSIIDRTVHDAMGQVRYRNNTCLFRTDLDLPTIVRHITKKETPQKIYCYACSDGSEPYSLALSLINKLGWEKAQGFFPIVARDIDRSVIRQAKDGTIKLTKDDINRLKWFTDKKDGIFFKYSGVRDCSDNSKFYFVDDKLRKCVDFGVGNFVHDSRHLDFHNSTVFFRNVWPYLSDNQQTVLTKNISERFDKTSTLVTGYFDKEKINLEADSRFAFDDLMLKAGLWQVKPRIYERHTMSDNPLNPHNWAKAVTHDWQTAAQNYIDFLKSLRKRPDLGFIS